MDLARAAIGEIVVIEHVGGERAFRRRLMELGLVPGTRVQLVGVAPLGDPLELLVRGCSLSIRRADAKSVAVRHESLPAQVEAHTAAAAKVDTGCCADGA